MEKVVFKYSDFFEDDGAFKNALKEVEDFGDKIVASAKKTQSEFKKALDLNNIEAVANYEKQAERLNNEFIKQQQILKDLNKTRTTAERLQNKLSQLKKGELDDTIALRLEIQKQTKERKDQIKEEQGLLTEYQKQSKRLNELRNEYKSLRLETGKSTDETEALREEIQKLDKTLKDVDAEVGQFQRNVGNYPKTTQRAQRGFASLSGFLLGIFVSNVQKSREESRLFQSTLDRLGSAARVIFSGLKELLTGSIIPSFQNFTLTVERSFLQLEKFTNGFGNDTELEKQIESINLKIKENSQLISNAPSISELFKEGVEIIQTNNKALDAMLLSEAKAIDQRNLLEAQLVRLSKLQEEQQAIADDGTVSLQVQEQALRESLKTKETILGLEKEIGEIELTNAINRVNLNARENNLGNIVNRQNAEKLSFLKDINIADKIQQENIDNLVSAVKNLGEIDKQVSLSRIENAKQQREISRDLFERELDFAIDVFDRQKSVNERIISSDKTVLSEKRKILKETIALSESSFDSQIKLTENFLRSSLETQGKSEEEVADAISKLNLRKLTELKDEEEIRKRLISFGLADDVTQGRILEIIRERKTFVQDIADIQEEISDKQIEDFNNLTLQRKEINATIKEETTESRVSDFEESKKFNKEKFDDSIEAINNEKTAKLEIVDLEESIARQLAITEDEKTRVKEEAIEKRRVLEKESLEAIEDLNKKANDKIKQQREDLASETRSIISSILDATIDAQSKTVQDAEKATDKQKDLVDDQEERARLGLENTLAFEQRELGKREAERIKEEQKQQRLEKIKALYSSYSNYASQGDGDNAIVKALRDFSILEAIQASFGDGGIVEDKIPTDGKGIIRGRSHQGRFGGIPILVEGKEGIFSGREMENLGKENFYKMKEIASLGKVGSNFFGKQRESLVSTTVVSNHTDPSLVYEMREVKKAIQNQTTSSWDFRKLFDGVVEIVETKQNRNKIKRNIHRINKPRL